MLDHTIEYYGNNYIKRSYNNHRVIYYYLENKNIVICTISAKLFRFLGDVDYKITLFPQNFNNQVTIKELNKWLLNKCGCEITSEYDLITSKSNSYSLEVLLC